jgi:hypothetical protein
MTLRVGRTKEGGDLTRQRRLAGAGGTDDDDAPKVIVA